MLKHLPGAGGEQLAIWKCERPFRQPVGVASKIEVALKIDRFVRAAATVIVFLALTSLVAVLLKYYLHSFNFLRPLDFDEEANIPTLLSSLSLLACSALLFAVRAVKSRTNDPFLKYWTALAVVFVVLGVDEACALHESAGHVLRRFYHPGGYLRHAWVMPGMLFVAVVGASYMRFLLHLPRVLRNRFVTSGLIYIGGALGMEMISGKYLDGRPGPDLAYGLMTIAEETMELAGSLLFLRALAKYLAELDFRASIGFEKAALGTVALDTGGPQSGSAKCPEISIPGAKNGCAKGVRA